MRRTTKTTLIALILITTAGCGARKEPPKTTELEIGGQRIKAELALTPAQKFKGLSGRKELCSNCGMLFVFEKAEERVFVMRNMEFPLDIIWINNEKIVKIDENAPPEGGDWKKEYSGGSPVDMVLEVNGGFCRKHDIQVGEEINYSQ